MGNGVLSVNAGVRVSHWDFNKETLISPRFSVGYVPARNTRLTLRLAGGVYYQAPFYKEYRIQKVDSVGNSYIALNPDIKSQRSTQIIIGGDYTFRAINRPFKFTAELYYKNLANLNSYEVDNLKVVYAGNNDGKGYIAGIDMKLFGQFVEGTDSWVCFSLMKANETQKGISVPMPTDQRYAVNVHFTDYFPGTEKWKMTLRLAIADGLPFGAPHSGLEHQDFRAPAYKRADIGMSYRLYERGNRKSAVKNAWLGIDCLNLFGINNVNSYYWVTDVTDQQYAVPNYLTGRQINVKLSVAL